ncbi:MAG TPA: glycosyltransferase family 2 protein [Planctomycetaceae bacterium]|nr:glycosyltransferase family 2 protein [Planctomycetaceae bacterium]
MTPVPATDSRRTLSRSLVSIVLPVYNEAAVLERLVEMIAVAVEPCGCRYEVLFVNDGSGDGSAALLDRLAGENPRVRVLHLSRNFGHQAAVQAGLAHARGDAVVVMDSDMQDEPAAIPAFLEQWQAGYDVVYAVRVDRKESLVKRALFRGFYRLLNLVSRIPIPNDAGNFGLVDRSAVEQIVAVGDCDRYFPGLRAWVGFRQVGVPVERAARHDDKPRVSFTGLCRLAKTAVLSFSSVPLAMFYAISAVSLAVFCGLAGFALYHKLFTGAAVPGWASVTMAASFFGTLNALGIGVLGEYVIRIYDQVRARPAFIVARRVNFDPGRGAGGSEMLDWLDGEWNEAAGGREAFTGRSPAAAGEWDMRTE